MKKKLCFVIGLTVLLFSLGSCSLLNSDSSKVTLPVNTMINNVADTSNASTSSTPASESPISDDPSDGLTKSKCTLYINGVASERSLVDYYSSDQDIHFIPAEDAANIIRYQYSFDRKLNQVTLSEGYKKIRMTIGSVHALVNNNSVHCPAPLFKEEVVFVPIDFVCKELGLKFARICDLSTPNFDSIIGIGIFTPNEVDLGNGFGTIKPHFFTMDFSTGSSKITSNSKSFNDLIFPQISGLKDTKLQNKLNRIFSSDRDAAIKNAKDIAHDSATIKGYWNYENSSYTIQGMKDGILSLTVFTDLYTGGAHSNQSVAAYNIDLNNGKILKLKDFFKNNSHYTSRLLAEIKKVWNGGTGDYDGVTMPDKLEDGSFFIENGNLYLFYSPYAIACYARWFVTFKIPLNNISDILNDKYHNF